MKRLFAKGMENFTYAVLAIFVVPVVLVFALKPIFPDQATRAYIILGVVLAIKAAFVASVLRQKENFEEEDKKTK